jgi:hypothetical protein
MYNSARDQTASMLDNAICEDYTQRGMYLNALRWLNTLRYICNHGLVNTKPEDPKDNEVPSSTWDSEAAQKAFDSMIGANAAMCIACTSNVAEVGLGSSEEAPGESSCPVTQFGKARLSACLFVLCDSCASRCSVDSQQSPCSHEPKCPTFDVYSLASIQAPKQSKSGFEMDPSATPTKLKALVENLKSSPGEKRFACLHDILHIMLRQTLTASSFLTGLSPLTSSSLFCDAPPYHLRELMVKCLPKSEQRPFELSKMSMRSALSWCL